MAISYLIVLVSQLYCIRLSVVFRRNLTKICLRLSVCFCVRYASFDTSIHSSLEVMVCFSVRCDEKDPTLFGNFCGNFDNNCCAIAISMRGCIDFAA